MQEQTANSVEEWLELFEQSRLVAEMALSNPKIANAAWFHTGLAIEYLLKAAIMAKERMNRWPDRGERRELYDHDLRNLANVLGASVLPDDPHAPAWAVVTGWHRNHGYVANRIPLAVISDLCEAAFGLDGVVQWISQSYLKHYSPVGGTITKN